ncbi:MAG: accessory gene regulator B family protein [Ruminococcus sp.]|nr:accessory gene regulator B family protein [Ruminococcus sp.]
MFAKTADKITQNLKENNAIDDEHYEICRYGLQQGLSILLNVFTTIVIGITLGMLWQAVLFTALYIPLRSNAGGYHAKTAVQCYFYSVLLIITVLLAIKYITIPNFICIITLLISIIVITILAPVEDQNKPLDDIEKYVYRKRTIIIAVIEGLFLFISMALNWTQVTLCITWLVFFMSAILLIGKVKNRIKSSGI